MLLNYHGNYSDNKDWSHLIAFHSGMEKKKRRENVRVTNTEMNVLVEVEGVLESLNFGNREDLQSEKRVL